MKRCFQAFAQSQGASCRHLHIGLPARTLKPTGALVINSKKLGPPQLTSTSKKGPKSKHEWALMSRARRKTDYEPSSPFEIREARITRASLIQEALENLVSMTCSTCRRPFIQQSTRQRSKGFYDLDKSKRDPLFNSMQRLVQTKDRDQTALVEKMTLRLRESTAPPDSLARAYAVAAGFAAKSNNLAWMRQLLQEMEMRHLTWTTGLLNACTGIFKEHSSIDQWLSVLKVFAQREVKADLSTWNQLLSLCRNEEKLLVFGKMDALEIVPDHVTLTVMMPIWRQQFSSATAFLQSLSAVRWTPSLGDALISMLIHDGERVSAIRLMLHSDELVYSSRACEKVLDAHLRYTRASPLSRSAKYRSAIELQDRFLERKIAFTPKMYLLFLRLAIKLQKPGWHRLLAESHELQCKLDPNFARRQTTMKRVLTMGS